MNARAKNHKIGRPKVTADSIPDLFYKYYPQYKNGNINKLEFCRLSKLSYPSIYKYLGIVENKNSCSSQNNSRGPRAAQDASGEHKNIVKINF